MEWEGAINQAKEGILTESRSREILNDILKRVGQSPMEAAKVKDFLNEWIESKTATKAKGTSRRYSDVTKSFITFLGETANLNITAVTPKLIQKFMDLQVKQGKSNKTANLAVKTLRAAFNTARRHGFITTNPADAVESLPENSASREAFTEDQLKQILDVSDNEWKGMILLGATCGLRLGDAARLTWGNIDLNRKVLHFYPQKTSHSGTKRKPQEVPILPDLEDYLLKLPVKSNKTDAPLFPVLGKRKTTGRTGLSNTFTALIAKAGIDNAAVSEKAGKKGRTVFAYGFHALRHTYISLMANIGVSKELRMKLAGHTSNAHDRYTHVELDTMTEALKKFPRLAENE